MQGARFELAYPFLKILRDQHFDSCPQAGAIDQAMRPLRDNH